MYLAFSVGAVLWGRFKVEFQIINAIGMIELESFCFAISHEIMDLGNKYQWMLKPLGESLWGTYNEGIRLATLEPNEPS